MIFVAKPAIDDESWQRLDPRETAEWLAIIDSAKSSRLALIEDFKNARKLNINDELYKRYKRFLMRQFQNKCAYCETKITLGQPGDVEHFRPKGRVVDENFRPLRVKYQGKEINHPGYYWLAYEWKNLLPSCIDCNRYRKHGNALVAPSPTPDSGAGKADRFPLKDEASRALMPDDEAKEVALLIDPSALDPAEHLEFLSNGSIKPKTPEGQATLEIFGLNRREDLMEARAIAFRDAVAQFRQYIAAINADSREMEQQTAKRINQMYRCKEPYSAMQRLAIDLMLDAYAQRGIPISMPLKE